MAVRGEMPDPERAADLAEFVETLGQLRQWAGAPSYRTLAARVGPLLPVPQSVSPSTVVDVFKPHRRRLDFDLVVAIVGALGVDAAGIDRWRRACVRVHGEAKTGGPAGVFRQLPAGLATFTGRSEAVKRLLQAAEPSLEEGARTVVISAIEGMAGIGKTQLALHVAHELVRAGRFADGQLYVNLRGFDPERPPADPAAVLETFLRHLGEPAQRIPDGVEQRAAMFRDRLAGRDALLLLDNAADTDQVRYLIPADPSCLVLVTSRRSLADLDDAVSCQLEVFTPDEALELLTRIVGPERVAAEPEAAREIVLACGLLPLAVSIVGARLRSRPVWNLRDLAARLERGPAEIASRDRKLTPVLDLSFHGLPDDAKAAFLALGLHPGGDCTAPALAAATGLSEFRTEPALEVLVHENLVRERRSGRFEAHDLLRAYAADLARTSESPIDPAIALRRYANWYLHSAHAAATAIQTVRLPVLSPVDDIRPLTFDSYDEALEWYDAERENLHAVHRAAAAADLHEVAAWLPVVLKQFMILRYHWNDSLEAHRLGVGQARSRADRSALAVVLHGMGFSLFELRRYDEALEAFGESSRLHEELGNRSEVEAVMSETGLVYRRLGRIRDAIANWQEAVAIAAEEGNQRSVMISNLNLTTAYYDLGELETSRDYCLRSLAAARELGERRAECIILGNLAELHRSDGDFEQARTTLLEKLQLSQTIGDRPNEADSLANLGDILQKLGRADEALPRLQAALDIYREIGSPAGDEVEELISTLRQGSESSPADTSG